MRKKRNIILIALTALLMIMISSAAKGQVIYWPGSYYYEYPSVIYQEIVPSRTVVTTTRTTESVSQPNALTTTSNADQGKSTSDDRPQVSIMLPEQLPGDALAQFAIKATRTRGTARRIEKSTLAGLPPADHGCTPPVMCYDAGSFA